MRRAHPTRRNLGRPDRRLRHRQDRQAVMPSARHILSVNPRRVHQPVFVVGAPRSGADLIGRALKASAGFHITIGQPSVLRVVYAFARRPSMYRGRTEAAATVIRDAFAQGWRGTAHPRLQCTLECRAPARLAAGARGPCVGPPGLDTAGATRDEPSRVSSVWGARGGGAREPAGTPARPQAPPPPAANPPTRAP